MTSKRRGFLFWVALACFAAVLALQLWFLVGPVNNLYDADSSDTLMWAEATYESGRPVSDTFYYASVLPFGGHLLMLPFIGAFGVSLTTHTIGMALFWLLFAAAALGLFRAMEWSWAESLFSASFFLLLLPSGRAMTGMYFQHIIYYSLAIFFLLIGLSLVLRVVRAERTALVQPKRGRVYALCALLTLWFALTATDGIMSLACFCAPCLGAFVLERLLDADFTFRKGWRSVALAGLMALGIALGMGARILMLRGSVGGEYGAYTSTFAPIDSWGNGLLSILRGWMEMWTDNIGQVSFLSAEGLKGLFSIGCALLFGLLPVAALVNYRKLETRGERMVVLAHWIMTALVLFGCVFGMIGRRFYTIHPTSVLCSLVLLRHALRRATRPWRRLAALTLAVLIAFAALCGASLLAYGKEPTEDNRRIRETVAYLEEQGLDYGYASFWNCNSFSVLSGGRLRIVPVKYKASWERYIPDTYQSDALWYDPQEGQARYFLMLSDNEVADFGAYIPEGASEVLTFDSYTFYVYDAFPFSVWFE